MWLICACSVGCGSSVLVVLGVVICACSVQGWVWSSVLVVFKVGCGSSVLVVLGVGHCACSVGCGHLC